MLERYYSRSKQCRNNFVTLCCAKTRRWYGQSLGKLGSDACDTLAPLITSEVTPFISLVYKDELSGRVMEELRKKDRDSLISEIRELRKSAMMKPRIDQVIQTQMINLLSLLEHFAMQRVFLVSRSNNFKH